MHFSNCGTHSIPIKSNVSNVRKGAYQWIILFD
nr:MAG TPA: hypothetical protein [Caudoviricetes sp.]